VSFNARSKIFICIDQTAYRTFKMRIRKVFRRGYFNYDVNDFIKLLNEKIVGFANYFSYSFKVRIQLSRLDFEIFN
jgi:hypothetical protein